MWLKVAIVVCLALLLLSLASGLVFLLKDKGATRRTLHSLGLRLALAAILMALLFYGIYSGQLRPQAPWDAGPTATTP